MTEITTDPGLIDECWRYFVLGVIQGLTEFLPISSTAHLKVIPIFLGWDDPGVSITAVLQFGSILAVITYFKKDLKKIIKGIFLAFKVGQWKEPSARLGIAIILGTIPIMIAGLLIKVFWPNFVHSPIRSLPAIALTSILMAILLGIAEKKGSRKKTISKISGRDGLIIGLGQMLALIPGTSRSGITLTTSIFDNWRREEAAKFSFLLGIPAISIAGIVEFNKVLIEKNFVGLAPILIGIITAGLVSWLTIDWLLKYLQSNNTLFFVAYRLVFGIVILFFWLGIPTN